MAQHFGLSEEAAEHRLEGWLGEYYASTNRLADSREPANPSLEI